MKKESLMIKRILLVAMIAVSLAGCAVLDKRIAELQSTVHRYAPIVGKNLLRVGDILITAQCSAIVPAGIQTADNILNIVAPNSAASIAVKAFFVTNSAITAQLCPFVTSVKASVGNVPNGTPVQTIAADVTS
jgi:type IV pilus biogenesis protein CpaD/CtpE